MVLFPGQVLLTTEKTNIFHFLLSNISGLLAENKNSYGNVVSAYEILLSTVHKPIVPVKTAFFATIKYYSQASEIGENTSVVHAAILKRISIPRYGTIGIHEQ